MTVSSTTRTAGPYVGVGTVTTYPFAFKVFQPSDVTAQETTVGVVSFLTLDSDFTVSLNGDQDTSPGGNVILSSALLTGSTLEIGSAVPATQDNTLTNAGGFFPDIVNDALDKGIIVSQQMLVEIARSIRVPEVGGVTSYLPPVSVRANALSAFDASGNPTATGFTVAQVSNAIAAAANSGSYLTTDTVLFLGGFGGDDGLALQTLAHFNQGRRIVNVLGNLLNFYTTCAVTDSGGTVIDLNNGQIIQHTQNIDSLQFQPTTVGVTNGFLNFCALVNGTVSHSTVSAAGSTSGGVSFTQCNGLRVQNMTFSNCDVTVAGCQLWRVIGCNFFANNGAGRGIDSACVHIKDAPYGSGSFQQCFTGVIDQWQGSATQVRGAVFRIHSVDGLDIGYGYGTSGSRAIINVLADRNGSYVSDVGIGRAYLDCGPGGGCPFGILISSDAFSASPVYGVIAHGTWAGNGSLSGFCNRKTESYAVGWIGGEIANFTSFAFDHSVSGNNTSIVIQGVQLSNNGSNGTSGDIRIDGGNAFAIGPNMHVGSKNVCLSITGAWVTGKATPGVNATGVAADIAYTSAAFSGGPFTMDAGSSTYVGVVANSWRVGVLSLTNYANNAAAIAAGLQVNRPYRTGNAQMIV